MLNEVSTSLPSETSAFFINGVPSPTLESQFEITCWQPFKPYAPTNSAIPTHDLAKYDETYNLIFLLCPKNVTESQYLIAQALCHLNENGTLYLCAENTANGKRLDKWINELGLNFDSFKAHKSRCLSIEYDKHNINQDILNSWLDAGKIQKNIQDFHSQAGLFCWNKIDRGSALLIAHINDKLKGKGADFGCGYGYLTKSLLERQQKIKHMDLFDADARALHCCTLNIPEQDKITTHWTDLSKPHKHSRLFDFIVMNPPFHEGKKQDHSIGQSFIINAAQNLAPRGILWMVANATLPYEDILKTYFYKVELIERKDGFKILRAAK